MQGSRAQVEIRSGATSFASRVHSSSILGHTFSTLAFTFLWHLPSIGMVNYGGGARGSAPTARETALTTVHTDEVSALVIDIGTSSLRAGYAGDDTPKAVVPTSHGYIEQMSTPSASEDVTMTDAGEEEKKPDKQAKLFISQNGPSMWREGMQVANPVQNGMSACSLDYHRAFQAQVYTASVHSPQLRPHPVTHLTRAHRSHALQRTGTSCPCY